MAMHPAYRTHSPPRRRLTAVICAVLPLLPGAALAMGAVVNADGTLAYPLADGVADLQYFLLAFAITMAFAWGVNRGAQAWWKRARASAPPFGFFSVAAIIAALLPAAVGVFAGPAFAVLFTGFGLDVPGPTLLVRYGYLSPAAFFLLLAMLYALRGKAWREGCFAGALIGEWVFMAMALAEVHGVYAG